MNQNERLERRWTAGVATAAVIAALAVPAAVMAQREARADERPAFEAASIKLAPPDAVRTLVMPTSPNRLRINSMTLTALIYAAYGDGGFNTSMHVTGGPDEGHHRRERAAANRRLTKQRERYPRRAIWLASLELP